jgi:hypothetical protein
LAIFTVDGVTYPLVTQNELTFGELEVIEDVSGQSLRQIEAEPSSKALMAFVLVSMRRVNPAASLDDVRKAGIAVLSDIEAVVAEPSGDDADPPSEPAPSGPQP